MQAYQKYRNRRQSHGKAAGRGAGKKLFLSNVPEVEAGIGGLSVAQLSEVPIGGRSEGVGQQRPEVRRSAAAARKGPLRLGASKSDFSRVSALGAPRRAPALCAHFGTRFRALLARDLGPLGPPMTTSEWPMGVERQSPPEADIPFRFSFMVMGPAALSIIQSACDSPAAQAMQQERCVSFGVGGGRRGLSRLPGERLEELMSVETQTAVG